MPTAERRRRAAVRRAAEGMSATEAVVAAEGAGREVEHTVDESGQELLQRPIDLKAPRKARTIPGKRVKVYHKRNTTVWLSDGKFLGPQAEGYILEVDAKHPNIAPHILRLAD